MLKRTASLVRRRPLQNAEAWVSAAEAQGRGGGLRGEAVGEHCYIISDAGEAL